MSPSIPTSVRLVVGVNIIRSIKLLINYSNKLKRDVFLLSGLNYASVFAIEGNPKIAYCLIIILDPN